MAATYEMTLGTMLEDLELLDLIGITETAISRTTDQMAQRNRDQLYQGFTSTGQRLRKYASPNYATVKQAMNPVPGYGNPDFFVTGQFYARLQAEVFGDIVGMHSSDSKAPYLEDRDGADNIYGLGEKQHEAYIDEDLAPVFYREVLEGLNLL